MSELRHAIDLVATCLAASAAFRTLVGAADAAAAAALVVRLDQPSPAAGAHALIRLPSDPVSRSGGAWVVRVTVEVVLVLPPSGQADHLALEAAVAAADAVAADLRANEAMHLLDCDTTGVERAAADEGDLAGWHIAGLRLALLGVSP